MSQPRTKDRVSTFTPSSPRQQRNCNPTRRIRDGGAKDEKMAKPVHTWLNKLMLKPWGNGYGELSSHSNGGSHCSLQSYHSTAKSPCQKSKDNVLAWTEAWKKYNHLWHTRSSFPSKSLVFIFARFYIHSMHVFVCVSGLLIDISYSWAKC